jgi:RimJ/RimL family protein N-acetyltransferase
MEIFSFHPYKTYTSQSDKKYKNIVKSIKHVLKKPYKNHKISSILEKIPLEFLKPTVKESEFPRTIFKGNLSAEIYTQQDINFLKYLHQEPEIAKTLISNGQPFSDEFMVSTIQEWQKNKGPFVPYVIHQNNIPVGYFELMPHEKEVELAYVVMPEFQGKGIGSMIMSIIMDDLLPSLKEKGYLKQFNTLSAHILDTNIPSIKMVEKYNFINTPLPAGRTFPNTWKRFEKSL